MDDIYLYLLTGLFTIAGATAGLILTCYLERRWLTSRRVKPAEPAVQALDAESLST